MQKPPWKHGQQHRGVEWSQGALIPAPSSPSPFLSTFTPTAPSLSTRLHLKWRHFKVPGERKCLRRKLWNLSKKHDPEPWTLSSKAPVPHGRQCSMSVCSSDLQDAKANWGNKNSFSHPCQMEVIPHFPQPSAVHHWRQTDSGYFNRSVWSWSMVPWLFTCN